MVVKRRQRWTLGAQVFLALLLILLWGLAVAGSVTS